MNVDDAPCFDDYHSDHEHEDDNITGDTGPLSHVLVVCRNCLQPRSPQESWLRSTLFHSTYTINDKICKLIIDSGSCANVISTEAVSKLDRSITV